VKERRVEREREREYCSCSVQDLKSVAFAVYINHIAVGVLFSSVECCELVFFMSGRGGTNSRIVICDKMALSEADCNSRPSTSSTLYEDQWQLAVMESAFALTQNHKLDGLH
jgi:hypothetical protein